MRTVQKYWLQLRMAAYELILVWWSYDGYNVNLASPFGTTFHKMKSYGLKCRRPCPQKFANQIQTRSKWFLSSKSLHITTTTITATVNPWKCCLFLHKSIWTFAFSNFYQMSSFFLSFWQVEEFKSIPLTAQSPLRGVACFRFFHIITIGLRSGLWLWRLVGLQW